MALSSLASSPARAEALPQRAADRSQGVRSGPPGRLPSGYAPGDFDEARAPAERLPRSLVGVNVLIVDDDPSTLEYFAAALDACGAVAVTAASAREALRAIAQGAPDVIVSDIAMPGEDGYWFLREIRRLGDGAVRQVPVVATTAYGREHPRERTLAAGFAAHLTKPVHPAVLCRAVAAQLGR